MNFGCYGGLPPFGMHVFECAVMEVHRALDDAANRRKGRRTGYKSLFELGQYADVTLVNADLDTLRLKFGHERSSIGAVSS